MSEMVERLSAAFAEAIADGEDNADYFARLALTTIRAPSFAMSNAGRNCVSGHMRAGVADLIWLAMIDEALTPSPPHQG